MALTSFDQSLYQEGLRRGYTPVQMAAVIGNRMAESGSNPLGSVGDSGTAKGAFQWRGPRFAALQQTGDINDPQTHINHFFNELEGSENKAGSALKNATSLGDANTAMAQYLRYGDNSGDKRLNYANQILQGIDPNAVQSQAQPQQQFNPMNGGSLGGGDWGNALIGAGAAIASINNPTQGAAIASMRSKPGSDVVSQYDAQTGTWSHYNKATGQYSQTKDPNWLNNMTQAYSAKKKIESDYKPPSDKTFETFGAHRDFLDRNSNLIDDVSDLRQYLKDNPNAGDWMQRFKSLGTSAVDGSGAITPEFKKKMQDAGLASTPEQQQFFGKLERLQQNLILQSQMQQKGVQTEGDAYRMGKAYFDSFSKMDGQSLDNALQDLYKQGLQNQQRVYGAYKGIYDRYSPGGDARFSPENSGIDRYAQQADISNKRLTEYEASKKQVQEQKANPTPAPAGGGTAAAPSASNRPALGDIFGGGGQKPPAPAPSPVGSVPSAPAASPQAGVRAVKAPNGEDLFLYPDGSLKNKQGKSIPPDVAKVILGQ